MKGKAIRSQNQTFGKSKPFWMNDIFNWRTFSIESNHLTFWMICAPQKKKKNWKSEKKKSKIEKIQQQSKRRVSLDLIKFTCSINFDRRSHSVPFDRTEFIICIRCLTTSLFSVFHAFPHFISSPLSTNSLEFSSSYSAIFRMRIGLCICHAINSPAITINTLTNVHMNAVKSSL